MGVRTFYWIVFSYSSKYSFELVFPSLALIRLSRNQTRYFSNCGMNSSVDIWVKALSAGCGISYSTCLRILKRLDGYEPYRSNPKKRHDGKYNTPEDVGEKWQMDVKFVPAECKSPKLPGCQRYYQYTVLDEASRKRFLYFAAEHSAYESRNALEKAIAFFGYAPKVLQTDNGSEFSDKAFRGEGSRYGRGYPNALEPFWPPTGSATNS